ncbi:hypothetical protein ACFE04_012442 [Oxalis oulophora]
MATIISQCYASTLAIGKMAALSSFTGTEDQQYLRRVSNVKMFGKSTISPDFIECSTNRITPFTYKHRRISMLRCGGDNSNSVVDEKKGDYDYDYDDSEDELDISVIGVGDGGSNAVDLLEENDIKGVYFFKYSEESKRDIADACSDADMMFITAGMGGDTGTIWAPKIAGMAKSLDIFTIGVVSSPFSFEGQARTKKAQEGIVALRENVDTLIVIQNDKLLSQVPLSTPKAELYKLSDDILGQIVRAISEMINIPFPVRPIKFVEVKNVLENAGSCMIGFGTATGKDKAIAAALNAIESPYLDVGIETAEGIVLNITGGSDLTVSEVNVAIAAIHELVNPEAKLLVGVVTDPSLTDQVKITFIATKCKCKEESEVKNLKVKIRAYLKKKGLQDPRC